MKKHIYSSKNLLSASSLTCLAVYCGLSLMPLQVQADPKATWEPQECRRIDHFDTYHGVKVQDPYRWLEDIESNDTKLWIKGEVEQTEAYMKSLPEREQIRERLAQIQNYERYSAPLERGGRIFYSYNSGLQNQSVICVIDDPINAPDKKRILLDPNNLSKDGTVAIAAWKISHNGKYISYGLAESGSDWNTWYVRDVETGQDLPDKLSWIKFSGTSWDIQDNGFYYSRYPSSDKGQDIKNINLNHTVYYHRLGTNQDEDTPVFANPDHPDWFVSANVSEDGRWLLIESEDIKSDFPGFHVKRLDVPDSKFEDLPLAHSAHFDLVTIDGDTVIARTDYQAPNFKVMSCDLSQPSDKRVWKTLISEHPYPIADVSRAGKILFVNFYRDAQNQIERYDIAGHHLGKLELPGLGSASIVPARSTDTYTHLSFTNFTTPGSIYRYDINSNALTPWKASNFNFDSKEYETKQVFFTSADGCRVPMFISSKRDLKKDGTIPVLMYGYGGFNIGLSPFFSTIGMKWMEMGGAYVVVNLRGGDEYGSKWHEMGTKTQKQNVFNDFIAAGHYLVDNKYTSPQRLAIMGGSNGGLLVGACLNQAPGLFGAAIPQVGVMDMLRYAQFTIGYNWVSDYGDVRNKEEFEALYAYSPYHNVKQGTYYPSTLITTGDHDDRVFPAHSFKYAAALQNAQAGPDPILIRIETSAGHGGGKPISKRLNESADILAFLIKALKIEANIPSEHPLDSEKISPTEK